MVFCTSCGVKNDAGAKFCSSCGKPLAGVQAAGPSSQPGTSSAAAQVNKCPACRAPIESFQTRCSSCGSELNTAQSGESVASFFKKLDELTEREYAADKAREGAGGRKKKKQPKVVVLFEVVAVISLILLLLQLTPLPGMLRTMSGVFSYDAGVNYIEFNISNDSEFPEDAIIVVTIMDGNMNPIEASITRLEQGLKVTLADSAGDYLVNVIDGVDKPFFYPESMRPVRMSGIIRLSFNGRALVRY